MTPAPERGPAEFDLAGFWQGWRDREARRGGGVQVQARIVPALLPELQRRFGSRLAVESDDSPVARLALASIEAARAETLAWGGAAEVLAPEALRRTVADFAEQAAAVYRD